MTKSLIVCNVVVHVQESCFFALTFFSTSFAIYFIVHVHSD